MITVSNAQLWVHDQDEALAFYTEKLGWEVRSDVTVAEICLSVGLNSIGLFTTSFTRTFGKSPTAYRAHFPPASHMAKIPACVLRVYARPSRQHV